MTGARNNNGWARLTAAVDTAGRLAPIAGRPADPSPDAPSLVSRVWSRLSYAFSQLFTARQKRFNLEVAVAVQGLLKAVEADRHAVTAGLNSLRDQVAQIREGATADLAAHLKMSEAAAADREALLARITHAEQCVQAFREIVDRLRLEVEPVHFRPGTFDQGVWETVNVANEYRLPDRFDARDVILDVGAHVGSFGHACLRRGAGKVYAFEVSPENYAQAAVNLSRFGGRAEVIHAAVWRSDQPPTTVYYAQSNDASNTGGGNVLSSIGQAPVPTLGLDQFLAELPARCGRERVRLMKLDCEGSEFPILLTSQQLDLIDEIVGEYHEIVTWQPVESARVAGYTAYTRDVLKERLERAGFTVELKHYADNLGAFFARRT